MPKSAETLKVCLGGIWETPGVTEQPSITLCRWKVAEVTEGPREGERYLIGFNQDDCEGRVSTPIVSFEDSTGRCVTKSGRVYRLVGPSGYDPDADYVWRIWQPANNISATRDVSSSYDKASAE
jgi:hypothetical protein